MKTENKLLEKICRYEQGELNKPETVELFQELLNTSVIWNLDWSYLDTMKYLVREKMVKVEVKE